MSRLSRVVRNRKLHLFNAQLWFAQRKAPLKAGDIQRNIIGMDYLFNVAPERKLIYIEVPKAGCTTVKNLLSASLYGRQFDNPHDCHDRRKSGLLGPSDIGLSRFEALLNDQDTLIFTVCRNPFARLKSCYLDKFAGLKFPEAKDSPIVRDLLGDTNADELSFRSFVQAACATAPTTGNGHWAPMSRMVPMFSGINIQVIKLENLLQELTPVLDRLEASAHVRGSLARPLNTAARVAEVEWTESLRDRVRLAYAADFRDFKYDTN